MGSEDLETWLRDRRSIRVRWTSSSDLADQDSSSFSEFQRENWIQLAQLIDEILHPEFQSEVIPGQRPGDVAVVLLPGRFEVPDRPATVPALTREGIDVERVILVPNFLLSGREAKNLMAAVAVDRGIDIPVPGANRVILPGDVGACCRVIIETQGTQEVMDRHLSRMIFAEKGDHWRRSRSTVENDSVQEAEKGLEPGSRLTSNPGNIVEKKAHRHREYRVMSAMPSETTEVAILNRILRPHSPEFSPETARDLLALDFDETDKVRMRELSAKARAGTLTAQDEADAGKYEMIGHLLNILQSNARRSLKTSHARSPESHRID